MKTSNDYTYTKRPKKRRDSYMAVGTFSLFRFLRLCWFITLYRFHVYNIIFLLLYAVYGYGDMMCIKSKNNDRFENQTLFKRVGS